MTPGAWLVSLHPLSPSQWQGSSARQAAGPWWWQGQPCLSPGARPWPPHLRLLCDDPCPCPGRKSKAKPNGKKPAAEEKKVYLEPEYAKARITDCEFKELVVLPREIDLNEWLASNSTWAGGAGPGLGGPQSTAISWKLKQGWLAPQWTRDSVGPDCTGGWDASARESQGWGRGCEAMAVAGVGGSQGSQNACTNGSFHGQLVLC